MTENHQLHYQYQSLPVGIDTQNQPTLLFLHGLFGDLNNLGVIAKHFADQYPILRVDLRNHGRSFHSPQMNYLAMAEDLKQLLINLNLDNVIVIGHSMGGKAAMMLAYIAPEIIAKLVVIDIAPVSYIGERHQNVFAGLFAAKSAKPINRQQAKFSLQKHISDEPTLQFMLKYFDPNAAEYFRFNLTSLYNNYQHIMGWTPVLVDKPTLFIRGGLSNYIQEQDTNTILTQFPQATSFTINGAGHLVHALKPDAVVRAIKKFLANQ